MNRTASTRAFALNPCPADPLGRQMVYMHMSSHYRRMYSAQSVVDSAAPTKRRAPKTAGAGGAHTHPQNFSSLVPALNRSVGSKNNARNTRVNSSDTNRNVRSRQSMRGDGSYPAVKPTPRSKHRDQAGTYLAKLNQLAKCPIQREVESTAFKPRILSSKVQSKLRNSSVYYPPRPRATNRLKLEEKDGKQRTETPRSKVQSSPPGSSRDSAYNGGVSSGGESHLKAKERALIQQKQRVWSSVNQKSRTPEDLRPLGNLGGTIGDVGRVGSPTYSYFSSIVSHGGTSDVGTNMDNRDNSDSFNEDIKSQIEEDIPREGAPREGTRTFGDDSQFGDVSPDEDHIEVASQTEASCDTFEEDEDETRSNMVDVLAEFTPRATIVHRSIQLEDYLSSEKSPVHSSANATTSTGSLQRKASACTSATFVEKIQPPAAKSVGTETADKYDEDFAIDKMGRLDTAYVRLIHAFTSDAVKRGVLTNKALKAIFQEHVTANKHTLDMNRMLEEWEKFRINLDIPKEDHELTANYGLGKVKWNRTDYLDPLISDPSDLWDETIGMIPRPTLFFPNYRTTNNVGTNVSRSFVNSDNNILLRKVETDLREIFDPVGIMDSLGLPSESKNNPVFPYTVTNPAPKNVEKASSPILERVNQPDQDLECVCRQTVCMCTSLDKIQGYMEKWLRSSEAKLDGALRRHSFPQTQKYSENSFKSFRARTPPVECCMEGTRLEPYHRFASSSKSVEAVEKFEHLVLPQPFPTTQEKKTVRMSPDLNKNYKMPEKMVVCLFDQQLAFSSNDSVNEGIFGRNGSEVGSVPLPDIDTSFVITDDNLRSSPLADTVIFGRKPTKPRTRDEFSLSLTGSNFTPIVDVDEPFKVLEQQDVVKWLNDNPKTPTATCE